jgi:CHAT domain-containing protein/tetratricopeptide (TPR) repeat protein
MKVNFKQTRFRINLVTSLLVILWNSTVVADLADEGPMLTVTAAQGVIKVTEAGGVSRTIATVKQGTRLWPFETKGNWYEVMDPKTQEHGWISNRDVSAVQYTREQQQQLSEAHESNTRGTTHFNKSEYKKAEPFYLKSLQVKLRILGEVHPDTATAYNNLGMMYLKMRDLKKAEPYLIKCYQINVQTQGEIHSSTSTTLNNIGVLYSTKANYSQAEPVYLKCLEITRNLVGDEHADVAKSLANLARLYGDMGKYDQAEEAYLESIKIYRKTLGENNLHTARALSSLGWLYYYMADYSKAETLLLDSVRIFQSLFGENNPDTARAINMLGSFYQTRGEHSKAESYYLQSLAIFQKTLGEKHPHVATSMYNVAMFYNGIGEFSKAESNFLQSLEIYRQVYGDFHPDTANVLNSFGLLYSNVGEYAKAEQYYLQSLKVRRKLFGNDNTIVANDLYSLGNFYQSTGQYSKAEPLLLKCLEIYLEAFGEQHPQSAGSFNSLGTLYLQLNEFSKAETHLLKSLSINRKLNGNEHVAVAHALGSLGGLNQQKEDLAKAESYYQQSLEIYLKVFGEGHSSTIGSFSDLSMIYALKGEFEKSVRLQDKARQNIRRHMVRVLPGLSEATQQVFLRERYRTGFESALTLGWIRKTDSKTASLSAAWLLNGKSAAQEAQAESAVMSTGQSAPLAQELRQVRDQISKRTINSGGKQNTEWLTRLKQREEELQKKLGNVGLNLQKRDPWVTVESVRNQIPKGTVLINIARFHEFNFKTSPQKQYWKPSRYAAWIIPATGAGEIQVIDLGESEPIDREIFSMRKQIQATLKTLPETGEVAAVAEFKKSITELSQRVLRPLEPAIEGMENIILSPDAELWTVPWGALLTSDDKYLIEKHQIHYVVSGRELVDQEKKSGETSASVIFADPDYNLGIDLAPVRTTRSQLKLRFSSSAHFPPLAASAAEAESIKPSLESFVGHPARLLLQAAAQEATFKELHRPRVLVLSTHGYFEQQPIFNQAANGPVQFENPFLRCGLALAGCNNRADALKSGKEDGILTGLEIVGTDLRGTELVVLSACETGLGDISNGEGVAGLRQAFQLAGAESIVSSLWQVEDNETAKLMDLFFKNLADGKTKSEALRQSQLTRIKIRRERNGAAHPFFWAAFTLTGQE